MITAMVFVFLLGLGIQDHDAIVGATAHVSVRRTEMLTESASVFKLKIIWGEAFAAQGRPARSGRAIATASLTHRAVFCD